MAISLPDDGNRMSRRIRMGLGLALVAGAAVALLISTHSDDTKSAAIARVATGLENPRGTAVLPDGRLLVVQAGNGLDTDDSMLETGSLGILDDLNRDGDYDDPGEIELVFSQVASYNTLTEFGTGHDEVGGLGDIVVLGDGRIFLTRDDPSAGYAPDGSSRGINVAEISPEFTFVRNLIARFATLNALAYDPGAGVFYIVESGANRAIAATTDGTIRVVAEFPTLEQGQQSVPSGIAIDPTTGDLLVALFSGQFGDETGGVVSYEPGASRIVRLDPATGTQTDEITGLTTAVDVAVDDVGNVFVVQLTSGVPPPRMSRDFELFDPNSEPDPGGYNRFAGSVTMYPADGSDPVPLASGLDTPTNITYFGGALYVSVGQGTPGRPIIGPKGETRIVGEIYLITGFLS